LVLGATARTKVISVRILILLKFPRFGGRSGKGETRVWWQRRTGANRSLFRFLRADDIGKIRGTVFVELPPWGRLRRSKDDDAVESRGLHRGHGVGGARRLGVHLPVSSQ